MMGNAEVKHIDPNGPTIEKELDLSRQVNYKQYCRHVEGRTSEGCLQELPSVSSNTVSLYEHLNAAFHAIVEIPAELPFHIPHLSHINLSHNQLTELPDTIGLLLHLKTLLLGYNRIHALPKTFFNLINLEKLDMSHNELKILPHEFIKLTALSKLNISYNKLKYLPVTLGGIKNLKVVITDNNRIQDPPESICQKGSEDILVYLRKNYKLSGQYTEQLPSSNHNVFPRVRGNNVQPSVLNPHSAQVQYIQSQTHTANTSSRIKTPLLPPPHASSLDADVLRDRIIGLLYGAAIGDAIGLATCCMSADECQFHYSTENVTYTDIVQDKLRVRWKPGDWTSNFDTMVLVLDSMIGWAGVLDELDYAKRLRTWSQKGYRELGDTTGVVLSETVKQVTEHPDFLQRPHLAASKTLASTVTHLFAAADNNVAVRSDDDANSTCSSVSSVSSSFSDMIAQSSVFPSSHPCIPAKLFGTDNGAVVQCAVLGIPNFFLPGEVETNTVRICKTTHSHPLCVASCVTVTNLIAQMLQVEMNTVRICKTTRSHLLCVASCVTVTNLIAQMLQGGQDLDCYKSVDEMIHKATTAAMGHIADLKLLEEFTKYTSLTNVAAIDARELYNMSYTLKALGAGLVGLRSQQTFKSFMMSLLPEGGDCNSNGCVAGALLGCKYGYSRLPTDWVQGLRKKQVEWLNVKINHLLDMIGLP